MLFGQVAVVGKLVLNALGKLLPVQMANQVLELLFVNVEIASERVHVQFNKVVVGDRFWQRKWLLFHIVNLNKA